MRQLCLFTVAIVVCLGLGTLFATSATSGAPEGFRAVPDGDALAVYGGQTDCNGSKYAKNTNGGCGGQSKAVHNPDCTYTQKYCAQKDTYIRTGNGQKKVQALIGCFECGGTQCGSYVKACDIVPCDQEEYKPCTDTEEEEAN